MQKHIKLTLCVGILTVVPFLTNNLLVRAEETRTVEIDSLDYELIISETLENMGEITSGYGLYFLKIPPSIQQILRGSAPTYHTDTPTLIQVPRNIATLSSDTIANWKLKVFTKKREISPASIMLDFKAEFYDEFEELKGASMASMPLNAIEEEKKSSNCVFKFCGIHMKGSGDTR